MIKFMRLRLRIQLQLKFTIFRVYVLVLFLQNYSDGLSSGKQKESAYIDFCESGNFRRVRSLDCEESINFLNKFHVPNCVCINGMWKARATFPSCKSKLVFGQGKCWDNTEFLFDSFQSFGTLLDPKELTIIIEEFPNITIDNLSSPISFPTKVTVQVLNGCLFQRKNAYCVQEGNGVKTLGQISKYKNIGPGIIVTRVKCFGRRVSTKYTENITVADIDFSPCTLNCETKPLETSRTREMLTPTDKNRFSFPKRKMVDSAFSKRNLQLRAHHFDFMHRKMLSFSIDSAFAPLTNFNPKPNFSYALLTQMSSIAGKICLNSGVPENFLENALQLMGLTTSRLFSFEYFTPLDFKLLEPLLNKCQESSAHSLDFIFNPCSKEIMKFHNGSKYGYQFVTLSPNYNVTEYHLVFDTVWKLMDLVHAVCFKTFRTSHTLFHKLEKGIETFFHIELRRLWKSPEIPSHLYTYLLGSNWKLHAINLEKCLISVYMHHPYRVRLERPLLTPEMRASSHRWSYIENGTLHYRTNLGGTGTTRSEVLPYIRKSMNRNPKRLLLDQDELTEESPMFDFPSKIEQTNWSKKLMIQSEARRRGPINMDELLDFNAKTVEQSEPKTRRRGSTNTGEMLDFNAKTTEQSEQETRRRGSTNADEMLDFNAKTIEQSERETRRRGSTNTGEMLDFNAKTIEQSEPETRRSGSSLANGPFPSNIENNKNFRGIRLSSIIDLTCGKSVCK